MYRFSNDNLNAGREAAYTTASIGRTFYFPMDVAFLGDVEMELAASLIIAVLSFYAKAQQSDFEIAPRTLGQRRNKPSSVKFR